MKMSKILRYAADNCLWNGYDIMQETQSSFCCYAVAFSYQVLSSKSANDSWTIANLVQKFLEHLGMPFYSAFDEFPDCEVRQSVRHAWLHFAADIAEEEGL